MLILMALIICSNRHPIEFISSKIPRDVHQSKIFGGIRFIIYHGSFGSS